MKQILVAAACFCLCGAGAAFAQNAAQSEPPETVEFAGHTWRVAAKSTALERHLGRDALALSGGRIWFDDANFSDGVIEFDAAYDEVTGFIGPMWRAEDDGHFEEIYFRAHLNGKPDAVQYTPVENGNSAWQIFSDENAIAAIDEKYGDWNHVKIVVKGDRADFYFNSDEPKLHVPDLKTDINAGGVGLRVSGRGGITVYFSNIVIRPLKDGDEIIGEPKDVPALPNGLITRWNISSVFAEAAVADALTLSKEAVDGLTWTLLDAETNGIANLSKLSKRRPDADSTVFIRMNIQSNRAQMKEMRFGYSDRARIYLNGKRVYFGDAGFQARNYRFLGIAGFFDSVGLDLKRGDNELLVAISETFGGWAWAGAIEDQSGLKLGD